MYAVGVCVNEAVFVWAIVILLRGTNCEISGVAGDC